MKLAPLPQFVKLEEIGSHQEPYTWIANDGQTYTSTTTIRDYKPIFHDCLPGRDWLEAHYKVGRRVVIVPVWEADRKEDEQRTHNP